MARAAAPDDANPWNRSAKTLKKTAPAGVKTAVERREIARPALFSHRVGGFHSRSRLFEL